MVVSRHAAVVRLFKLEDKVLEGMDVSQQRRLNGARRTFGDQAEDMIHMNYRIVDGWQVSLAGFACLFGPVGSSRIFSITWRPGPY